PHGRLRRRPRPASLVSFLASRLETGRDPPSAGPFSLGSFLRWRTAVGLRQAQGDRVQAKRSPKKAVGSHYFILKSASTVAENVSSPACTCAPVAASALKARASANTGTGAGRPA